jgi:hypothetical protein
MSHPKKTERGGPPEECRAILDRLREGLPLEPVPRQPAGPVEAFFRTPSFRAEVELWESVVPTEWQVLLGKVDRGELELFDWFADYRATWAARNPAHSGIVFADAEGGKSVAAAGCLLEDARRGRSVGWLDGYDIPRFMEQRRYQPCAALSDARLVQVLCIDEMAGQLQAPWAVWNELDGLVKYRFARRKSTLLVTTATPAQLLEKFGREFMRRFPPELRVGVG